MPTSRLSNCLVPSMRCKFLQRE